MNTLRALFQRVAVSEPCWRASKFLEQANIAAPSLFSSLEITVTVRTIRANPRRETATGVLRDLAALPNRRCHRRIERLSEHI